MPKAYSEDLRKRVVSAYRCGQSASDVALQYAVHVSCVYRWDTIEQSTGSLKPLYKAGDRSIIKDDGAFLAFATAHAHSTLQQMADHWSDEVSIFAISRKLRKLGITRKKTPTATVSVMKKSARRF
jgi:transposase